QPGLFSGRTRRDFADHDLLRVIDVGLKADQDRSRRDQKRSNDVEGGTSDGHQEALPFRLREEFVNRAFALPLHQLHILAAEFNVTSEWNRAETVIGIAESKTEQARSEADRKSFDRDSQQLSDDEVTEFVDHDHRAQD